MKREYGLEGRVSIVLRMQTEDGFYPINELRNLAIRYSTTSHFFLSDMDMWPSFELYEALKALPSFILQDDFFSGIVPAFEVKKPECDSIEKCVEKLHLWSVLMDRVAPDASPDKAGANRLSQEQDVLPVPREQVYARAPAVSR